MRAGQPEKALNQVLAWRKKYREYSSELVKIEATAQQHLGNFKVALALVAELEKITELDAHMRSVRAVCLRGLNDAPGAIEVLESNLADNPTHGESWHNLAVIRSDQGEWDKAKAAALKAEQCLPKHVSVIRNLGRIYINLREAEPARELYQCLLDLGEDEGEVWQGLGAAYILSNAWPQARECLLKAIEVKPELPSSYANLAIVEKNLGDWKECARLLRHAIANESSNVEHHWNLALCLLGLGEFEEGWREYEARYDPKRVVRDKVSLPPVTLPMLRPGEPVAGKVVAIVAEQGFGDSLQFCRFARELKSQGATVILMMPEPLAPLMKTLPWADFVYTKWSQAANAHCWTFVLSLPYLVGANSGSFDGYAPYLFAMQGRAARWKERLARHGGSFTVGLVWAGRASHSNDVNRSMALSQFDALADVPGVRFVSLQKGDTQGALTATALTIDPVGDQIEDFADTAAILSQIDLLISIDSAPVHLAGALNRPAWVLIPFTPDFRWRLSGDSTSWYESVRLFRQSTASDWPGVLADVRQALAQAVAAKPNAPLPAAQLLPDLPADGAEAGIQAVLRQAVVCHVAAQPVAKDYYLWVLKHAPDNLDALRNLAAFYRSSGQMQAAKQLYEQTLPKATRDATFLANYSNFLLDTQAYQQAQDIAQRCLALEPHNPAANYVYATCLTRDGHYPQAEQALAIALEKEPNKREFLTLRGMHLVKHKHYVQAKQCFETVLASHPRHAEAYMGLARVYMDQDELDLALATHNKAIEFKPNLAESHLNKSVILSWLGRYEEAVQSVQEALKLSPNEAEAHFHLGLYYLALGNFNQGGPEYQWRYHPQRLAKNRISLPAFSKPQWQGESLQGKVILIFPEQGFGDYIQFIRYAKLLRERGATVWAAVKPPLHQLMLTCPYIDRLLQEGEKVTNYDYWTFPLSLPYLLGTEMATIPATVPYLSADPALVQRWAARLATLGPAGTLRVGLIWSGSTLHSGDRWRTIPPEQYAPLLKVPGATFIGLDKGDNASSQCLIGGRQIVNLGPEIENFADSAAILSQIDLLITVDSAPAHVSGALNKPVWVLIGSTHDWRWFVGREDTPWYPSMRLFRQQTRNDWSAVLESVRQNLVLLVGQQSA